VDARRLTLVAVLALALAGCGTEAESTAEKAFGEMSDRDEELAGGVTTEIRRFSERYTDLVAAMNVPDAQDARTAVDAMAEHIDKAKDLVADADNAEWRSTYEDYLRAMERVTTAAERIVAYLEAPGGAKPKLERRLATQFQQAAAEAQKVDKALVDRIAEHAGPEEREKLEKQYRDAQRRFEEETGQ
jgi:hypothetical protein